MASIADVAAVVARDYPVFPCALVGSDKKPLIRWKEGAVRGEDAARVLFVRFPGADLIGVPTGSVSGILVIDIDVKDGARGREWYEAEKHRLGRTRAHRTRSGGVQLVYAWPAGVEIRNSASRLAPGVDVRGEGGYVVWPGSVGYSVIDAVGVAPCPAWLLDALLALKPRAVDVRAVDGTAVADRLVAAEMVGDGSAWGLAALRRACAAIVGAEDGTKHETLNREAYAVAGLVSGGELKEAAAWEALAAALGEIEPACRDVRAARETLREAWAAGLARPRDVGARKLAEARADFAGVDVGMAEAKTLLGDDLSEAEAGTLQDKAFRDHVWIEGVERFGSLVDGAVLTTRQFSVRLNWWGPPMSTSKSAAALFLADERCRKVEGITYLPGGARVAKEDGLGWCFNRWRPSSLVPREGDVTPWLRHVEYVVPDPRVRGIVLDVLAFILQHQTVKMNYAMVLGGLPGIGKDMMVAPLVRALGVHNVSVISMADLEAAQNDWCAGARMVVVNEAHSMSRVAAAERLKPHIAAPPWVIRVNTKNVPQYQIPNRHVMLFFTNRRDAVVIERGDRRYFVVWSEAEKQPEDYYRAVWRWFEAGGFEAVAAWLLARDLSAFNPHGEAPMTAEKADMERHTMSDLQSAVQDAIEGEDWPDLVNPGDLAVRLNREAGTRGRAVTGKGVAVAILNAGARIVQAGRMIRLPVACATGADRVRLYSVRNHALYSEIPAAALARAFSKMWAEKDGKAFVDTGSTLSLVTHSDLL